MIDDSAKYKPEDHHDFKVCIKLSSFIITVKVIDIEPLDVMGAECYIPCIHMCFRRLGDFNRHVVISLKLSLRVQYSNN